MFKQNNKIKCVCLCFFLFYSIHYNGILMYRMRTMKNCKRFFSNLSWFGSNSSGLSLLFADTILLEWAHECQFVGWCLETTVSHFWGGIDEFQLDLFQCWSFGVSDQWFTQGDDTFAWTNAATLDHDEIVLDFTVVREATHWGDWFVRQIVLGGSVVLDDL